MDIDYEKINKLNKKFPNKEAEEISKIIADCTLPLFDLLYDAKKVSHEFYLQMFIGVLSSIILQSSNNIDISLSDLEKIYIGTKKYIKQLDIDLNKD